MLGAIVVRKGVDIRVPRTIRLPRELAMGDNVIHLVGGGFAVIAFNAGAGAN